MIMKTKEEKMSKNLADLLGRRNRNPAVNIERECYTMATVDGDEAEIVMYGEIVEERPKKSWWSDEDAEGNYIILSEFLDDLKEISGVKKLTIRLNSLGGDAYAAIPIHNRLRELKAEKTVIVDGVAMSGGSLIMCAADTVKVNASSLIMVHKCWSFIWGGFNADELRQIATSNDAVDKAQVAIYKRKTGISEEDILSMMSDETYMTGLEAVEKGFADELIEGEAPAIAASADLRTLYVNGRRMRLTNPLSNLPESISTVIPEEVKTNKKSAEPGDEEGGKTMAKNLEELRAENPELVEQLMAEVRAEAKDTDGLKAAVEAERKRIKEIDEIAVLYDDETVNEAKFGENPCTAQEMAFVAAKKAAKKGQQFTKDLEDDSKTSKASIVTAAPANPEDDETKPVTPEELREMGRAMAREILSKEGK